MPNVYLFFWLMMLGVSQPVTEAAPHSKRCAPQKLPSPAARPGRWVPDKAVREFANKIEENRIAEMSLGGYFIGVDEFNPNWSIKNRELIHLFLDALRNAEYWSGNSELAANRSSAIVFYLKALKEGEDNPKFPLNVWGFNEHFGPPFERALLKLAEFRADELRNFIKRNAKTIRLLSITKGKTVDSSIELGLVLKELVKIKTSDGFNYLNGNDRKLSFTLEDGKTTSFYLSLREPPKEKPEKPDPFFASAFYTLAKPDPVEKSVGK